MPEILYHYTSKAGLLGIINSKCLWAANILYLNDAAEFSYTLQLGADVLETKMKNTTLKDNELKLIHKMYDVMKGRLEFGIPNTYVACFSEVDDSLSQWRAYCPKTGGFSIGFDYEYLRSLASDQNYELKECVYDEKPELPSNKSRGLKEVERIIDKHSKEATNWTLNGKDLDVDTGDRIVFDFLYELAYVATWMKHEAFKEEKEWRVISSIHNVDVSSVFHREGTSMIVPYREFKLVKDDQPLQISGIVIGPTPHPELALGSLNSLLDSKGFKLPDVLCRLSNIPYRAW